MQVRDAWKIAEERPKRNERKAALFLIQLNSGKHPCPQHVIDDVVVEAKNNALRTQEILKLKVMSVLEKAGITFDEIPGLEQVFDDIMPDDGKVDAYKNLGTKHLQESFFRENFPVGVSNKFLLFFLPLSSHTKVTKPRFPLFTQSL